MKIGIAFDLVPGDRDARDRDDRYEEFDKPETVAALADALRGAGHEVVPLGDGRAFLERVLADPPHFVWNLAEGEGVGRCREARVPAVLELLGIPYSGSDPLTLALCLDKPMAKLVVAGATAVKVPAGWVVPADADRARIEDGFASYYNDAHARGTLILKPAYEGSSKGIRSNCLADGVDEAVALWARLVRDYEQPVLVEEYIAGDEVTVGVIGNGSRAEVLGALRVAPRVPDDRFVYSLERKRVWDDSLVFEAPARLPEETGKRLFRAALAAYRALGCRDVARVDFRVRDGVPYFLEANPLPGLAPDWSDLALIARGTGLSYAGLIGRILDVALTRTGLMTEGPKGGPP